MEHWFDDLAKKLATGDRSRRSFLGGLAVLLTGTAAVSLLPAHAAPLQRARRRRLPDANTNANTAPTQGQASGRVASMQPSNDVSLTGGPCTVTRKGKSEVRTLTSSTSANGFEITLHQKQSTGPMQNEHDVSIDVNGKPQFSVMRRKAGPGGGPPALVITAGPVFGFQNLRLTSQDGRTLQGTINGRAIAPTNIEGGSKLNGIQFADGQPGPSITENANLRNAIRQAFLKASQDAKQCFPSEPIAEGHRRNEITGEPGAVYESPANAGFSKACLGCFNNCYSQYNDCAKQGAEDCAGPWWFLCLPAYMATTCGPNQDSCENKCSYGPICCPVKCDNAPPSNGPGLCCAAGNKCVDATNGYCCPDGYNTACTSGFCVCCPGNQAVCNGLCCAPGQACSKQGTCCPSASICHGECCTAGTKCLPGGCCLARNVCGNTCCDGVCKNGKCTPAPSPGSICLTGVMINGKCCPSDLACGNVCCPKGQACVDPKNGTCKKLQCSAGEAVCMSPMPNGSSTAICCSGKNPTCCNGQCCKPGQTCCTGKKGVFGCHPQANCSGQVIK